VSDYPPIEDYALIGDCKSAALISRNGGIDWLCLPHFAGPSLFAALLDRDRGGCFSIAPVQCTKIRRRYLDDSAVLETVFTTGSGEVRLTDCMTVRPDRDNDRESLEPQSEIIRTIECLSGRVEMRILYQPRPGYACRKVKLRGLGKAGWSCSSGNHWYHLHSSCQLDHGGVEGGILTTLCLEAGEKHYFSLCYVQNDIGVILPLGAEAERRINRTLDWWRQWTGLCRYNGPYKKEVLRSAVTLKLMTYSLSGAVVAAPTASLPEAFGGARNWDYRYCWIRDASIVLRAFTELGYFYEGAAFIDWLLHATSLSHPRLQVVYNIFGETRLDEKILHWLEGYRRSAPVRIGNLAHSQRQLDVYGSVLMAVDEYACLGGRLDPYEKKLLVRLGDAICRLWRLKDSSIWEIRGQPQEYTYSKFMCWLGLDCLLRMHERGFLKVDVPRLQQECAAIRDAIESGAYRPDINAYSGILRADMTDASLLIMGLKRYLPPRDPRMQGHFRYLQRELASGVHFYRYAVPGDDMRAQEASFVLCSFWAAEFQALAGEITQASRAFEELLSCANDVGLYAEEIDPVTGAHLGNFPQAFTHVGLINAAHSLLAATQGKAESSPQ
jgi:GH15 family glucan-1,4-alpha-glucosidase